MEPEAANEREVKPTPRGVFAVPAAEAERRSGTKRPRWRGWLEAGLVAAAMAVVVWFFHLTVKMNNGFEDLGDLDYSQLLVRGWKKGQLNLDKEPRPELLALQDPYDPNQNAPYKMGDATLYKGKYYIYFGPTPALTLMLPYSLVMGREMTMGTATFVFCCVAFFAASGLWLAIRRRYFPESSMAIAPLGVLAIGFGTHLLALAQRPMIWELPISSGIAYSLLAAVAAYRAIHGTRPLVAMGVAGLCLGLAVGARPTCLLGCVLLLPPLWLAWRERDPRRSWWRMGVAAAAPLALCGAAILWHNYARFENPFELGQNYQLSGAYEGKLTHFSVRFFLHNFAVYFFQLLRWTADFPYALAVGIPIDHIPGYFGTEEVAGLAVTFPFVWFVLALPLAWRKRDEGEARRFTAALGCVAGYTLPVMALVMCYFSTTTRYQADFAVGFAMLALIGLLALERWAQERRRARRVTLAAGGLVAVTMAVGFLMSFDYHGRSVRHSAPAAWRTLHRGLEGIVAGTGHALGKLTGPRVLKVRFKQQPTGTVETFWQPTDPRATERIVVQHIGDHLIRFGYVRNEAEPVWGRPLKWDTDHTHTVSVQLPSLYPEIEDNWWSAVRRSWEFRERTSAAVWFSGGRALGLVVQPVPVGITPGGVVGVGFTGEVRKVMTRLYREDEIESGLPDPHLPRGGTLRMHVVLPWRLQELGEPLISTGVHYRSGIVFVLPTANGVKLAYENYGAERVESAEFQRDPRGHLVEIVLPTFQPEAFGAETEGEVIVRLDGREMIRSHQKGYYYHPGTEEIGLNPFGHTCASEFRGWLRDVKWVLPERAGAPERRR